MWLLEREQGGKARLGDLSDAQATAPFCGGSSWVPEGGGTCKHLGLEHLSVRRGALHGWDG